MSKYELPEKVYHSGHPALLHYLWLDAGLKTLAKLEADPDKVRHDLPPRGTQIPGMKMKVRIEKGGIKRLQAVAPTYQEFKDGLEALKEKVRQEAEAQDQHVDLVKGQKVDTSSFKERLKHLGLDCYLKYPLYLGAAIRGYYFDEPWREITRHIKDFYVQSLNARPWEKHTYGFEFVPPERGVWDIEVVLTPLNASFSETEEPFAGWGQTGFASMAPRLTDKGTPDDEDWKEDQKRATNAWHSQLFMQQKHPTDPHPKELLFECFRSGTVAYPFTLPNNDQERRTYLAGQKARELVKAMLVRQLERDGRGDEPKLPMTLVTVNVQTATAKARFKLFREKLGIEDQFGAFRALANDEALEFETKSDGVVPVKLDVFTFNFGVNGASAKKWVVHRWGREFQIENNDTQFEQFAKAHTDWVIAMDLRVKLLTNDLKKAPDPKKEAERDELVWRIARSGELIAQIRENLHEGTNYETPCRVTYLAHLMGFHVHFNCKSGKDRTSVLALETHFLAIRTRTRKGQDDESVPPYHNVITDEDERALHRKLIFESGNLEIQEANTGVPGYKIAPHRHMNFESELCRRFGKWIDLAIGLCREGEVKEYYKEDSDKNPMWNARRGDCLNYARKIIRQD